MWLETSLGHSAISPAKVQMPSGMSTTTRIRSARWCRAASFRPRLLVESLRRLVVSIACEWGILRLGLVIVTPRPRRHLGDRGPQSGPQSTFRGWPSRLPRPPRPVLARRHWPAAAAGALGAGALIAALVVSGGSGAGAQPAPAAPTTGSVSAPADGILRGGHGRPGEGRADREEAEDPRARSGHLHPGRRRRAEGGRLRCPTAAVRRQGREEPPVRRRRDGSGDPDHPQRPAELDRGR